MATASTPKTIKQFMDEAQYSEGAVQFIENTGRTNAEWQDRINSRRAQAEVAKLTARPGSGQYAHDIRTITADEESHKRKVEMDEREIARLKDRYSDLTPVSDDAIKQILAQPMPEDPKTQQIIKALAILLKREKERAAGETRRNVQHEYALGGR